MDRRSLLKNAGIAGVLAAGIAPAVHAQAVVRWRLVSSFPKSLDILFGAAELFASNVGSMTGGKFQISVHAGGELMPALGVVDGVQSASVEMAHTAPSWFYGKDPTFCLGGAVPFGMNARQQNAWMHEGNGLKLMRAFYARYNIVNLPGGNTGAPAVGWFRKDLKSLAGLKGLKLRLSPFAGKVLEPFGVVAPPVPDAELYPALEKGRLDGLAWVGPWDDQKLGLNKIAPFCFYPGWWEGGCALDFYINTAAWEGLSADYKAVVEAAAAQANITTTARYDARNPVALRQLVAAGTRLRPFPQDVMHAAFKSARQVCADLGNRNPEWKRIYGDWSKFLAEQNTWSRYGEGAFDRFMQQQKP